MVMRMERFDTLGSIDYTIMMLKLKKRDMQETWRSTAYLCHHILQRGDYHT